jgi:drug/metabolite transporter (DMT)-like permease
MNLSGEVKIILGSALFAFIPVCVKLAPGVGIESLLFGRIFFASLIFLIAFKKRSSLFKIPKKDMFLLLIWSFIMSAAMLTYFYAIRFCGAAISSALLGIQPVIIIFLAFVILKEVITSRSIVAGMLTLLGIYFISDLKTDSSGSTILIGEVLAITSAILLAFNFIYQKKYLAHFSSQKLVFYQSVFQLPVFLPFFIMDTNAISTSFIFSSLTLGVFCTVIAYTLIYKGASEVEAQKIGILQSVEFVLPVFVGYYFFNEGMDVFKLVGISLILISCVLVHSKSYKTELQKG